MAKGKAQSRPLFVVAVDGSGAAAKAADRAVELANKLGAELAILTVVEPRGEGPGPRRPQVRGEEGGPEATLEREWRRAKQEGVAATAEQLEGFDAAQEIVRYAENKGADMIVVGSRGLTGIKRIMLGSVAAKVVALAHCPVLVVR